MIGRRTLALCVVLGVAFLAALIGRRGPVPPTSARGCASAFPSPAPGSSCRGEGSTTSSPARSRDTSSPGTDARVATTDVDVWSRGETGSPVGPGVTTRRSVVFHAARVPPKAATSSFRPFLGCIPTSGGGGRALTAYKSPGQAVAGAFSVVVNAPIRGATKTVRASCPASAQLLGASSSDRVPPGGLAVGVAARRRQGAARRRPAARSLHASRQLPPQARVPRCRCGLSARGSGSPMSFASPYLLATLVRAAPWRSPATCGSNDGRRGPRSRSPTWPCSRRSRPARTGAAILIAGLLLGAVALLCVAVARPRVPIDTTWDRATVVLVVDVSLLDGRDGRCSEPARGGAGRDHILCESRAEPRQGRPRLLCRRLGRRHLADDRSRPPQGRHRVARSRIWNGDRRCSRPRRRAHAPVDRAGGDGQACRRPRPLDWCHRPSLGRHPDKRPAVPGRRGPARQGSRHPCLHDRARDAHRNGNDRPQRPGRSSSRCPPTGRRWRGSPSRRGARRSTSPTRRSSSSVYERLGKIVATTSEAARGQCRPSSVSPRCC